MKNRFGNIALRWTARGAVAIAAFFVILVGAGALYEFWAQSTAEARFPPPGKRVELGNGRHIHIHCRGEGSPIVVLLSGLDANGALAWSAVDEQIAAFTRVCGYDRAGIMYSDPFPGIHDARQSTADLHAALAGAGEKGPFVLAGHSLGGPYMDDYVHTYPDDVAGLVFVDGSHPDQIQAFEPIGINKASSRAEFMLKMMVRLTWTGWTRLPAFGNSDGGMSEKAGANAQAFLGRSLPAVMQEQAALADILAQAGSLRELGPQPLGDRPIVVLTAQKPASPAMLAAQGLTEAQSAQMREIWARLHDDEASWSTHSRHQLLPDATHYIQFDRPDAVIGAIHEVVDAVRVK